MDGRFQQHQSDSFSIANLLSMQPKHNHHHHHPHRVIHPDPLSHLRKLTSLPDAPDTNALLAIHHQQQQQQQHYHHHPPGSAPPFFCNNPAIPSTSGHPSMMTSTAPGTSPAEGFNVKPEESMTPNGAMMEAAASNELLQTDPASIDSADSGKNYKKKIHATSFSSNRDQKSKDINV
jgi:hypothetical protein